MTKSGGDGHSMLAAARADVYAIRVFLNTLSDFFDSCVLGFWYGFIRFNNYEYVSLTFLSEQSSEFYYLKIERMIWNLK